MVLVEKGKKYPKPDKINLLSEHLDVSYDELVSLKLDKNLAPIGEILQSKVLKDIEKELMRTLGMEEHQRLSVTHTNTNNFHMHIAINKIHPITKHIINPHKSKIKINNKAAELEVKHKLQKTNHLLSPAVLK